MKKTIIILTLGLTVGCKSFSAKHNEHKAFYYAENGIKYALVNLYRSADIDPNATNSTGDSLFMVACANENYVIADYLLNKGANIDAKNQNGHTALAKAYVYNKNVLYAFLISRGAKENQRDKNGMTIENYHTKISKYWKR